MNDSCHRWQTHSRRSHPCAFHQTKTLSERSQRRVKAATWNHRNASKLSCPIHPLLLRTLRETSMSEVKRPSGAQSPSKCKWLKTTPQGQVCYCRSHSWFWKACNITWANIASVRAAGFPRCGCPDMILKWGGQTFCRWNIHGPINLIET